MTTTTLPTITHRIAYDATTRDYACYVSVGGDPEQYIGSADSYRAGELKCLAYRRDLLESDLVIPASTLDGQCGDCGQALDAMGLCGCRDEYQDDQTRYRDAEADEPNPWQQPIRPAPLSCICGQPALSVAPHGAFCGACHEAVDLWRLWKQNSTEFVAELRRQSARLNEVAARLCVYLNAKNESALGTDSILAMWRNLLDDDDPPEPRYYVVAARQQVAA